MTRGNFIKILTTALLIFACLVLIIVWYILIFVSVLSLSGQLMKYWGGNWRINEGEFMVGLLALNASFILGFLGVIPAYFSYNFLLKKLTARFGMRVDRPKRLFALSALLIYGLPLLLLFWALVKP